MNGQDSWGFFKDVVVVSHIQRIGCQPEKTTLHGGQSRSWSAEQGKKKNVRQRPPPPPPPSRARCSFGENRINKKITRRIHMSRRYAGRRYAGGLGPSRVRTRTPTTRRLGQWVSLRKILRFRVRLQLSQSRCLSLLLAMYRALDGWMLARAPASPAQGLHHHGPRYFNFLISVQCVALRSLDLLIKTGWSVIFPVFC